jgi:hypothetical protein
MVLSIMFNPENPILRPDIVHKAFDLYRYYQQSSISAITGMKIEADTGLPPELNNLYKLLPDEFTRANAAAICVSLGLNERRFDTALRKKDFMDLFKRTGQGRYVKL